jgi:AraC-like DNA-binding protein
MEIITTDLSVRYTAAELAKQFMVSETSIKNYFRGVYGKGYREFINELRMERAAELLLENKHKVSEISEMVGFATQSRFAKAFKNYWDKSPLEYKRSCGEGMK